jgi:hypothetical protein
VEGKLVGALNTDATGVARLKLTSSSTLSDGNLALPLSVQPLSNAHLIEVLNETGAAVLTVTF